MKKETLEEIAERKFQNIGDRLIFEDGAKWQQERSYSEEEIMTMLYCFHYDLVNSNIDTKEEWFEQFKKK